MWSWSSKNWPAECPKDRKREPLSVALKVIIIVKNMLLEYRSFKSKTNKVDNNDNSYYAQFYERPGGSVWRPRDRRRHCLKLLDVDLLS